MDTSSSQTEVLREKEAKALELWDKIHHSKEQHGYSSKSPSENQEDREKFIEAVMNSECRIC